MYRQPMHYPPLYIGGQHQYQMQTTTPRKQVTNQFCDPMVMYNPIQYPMNPAVQQMPSSSMYGHNVYPKKTFQEAPPPHQNIYSGFQRMQYPNFQMYQMQQKITKESSFPQPPKIKEKQISKNNIPFPNTIIQGIPNFIFPISSPHFDLDLSEPPGFFNIIGRGNLPSLSFDSGIVCPTQEVAK
ncbi:hypothetical protein GPJ56_010879 [Histomonas meleagridis]|uniref:uncharacterized protein n=1 Tax=Histomonas meleagridis TaxID=135588 RepID=UPI00355968E4|nr:hypothetical protein GPJ56_010879 [Histomonas meleagridis]KAH0803699.1 hypothetical protein GO595_003473 [Histomonas meleagridis]